MSFQYNTAEKMMMSFVNDRSPLLALAHQGAAASVFIRGGAIQGLYPVPACSPRGGGFDFHPKQATAVRLYEQGLCLRHKSFLLASG